MITAIRVAQYVTGLACIACLLFGFGTAWFVVGMFAGVLSLIFDGLRRSIEKQRERERLAEWERNRIPLTAIHEAIEREWAKRGFVNVEIVHHHPQSWQHIDGGQRPVWPNEIGAPE